MNEVYLLLGTNLGERESYLHSARQEIALRVGRILAASSIYESEAWGVTDQAGFLNQVLLVASPSSPHALLEITQQIELELGRIRLKKWGERSIDIDILYYNDWLVETSNLTIPHPYIQDRRFTLVPLEELSANFIHPKLNKSQQSLLAECTDDLKVQLFKS